MYCYKEVKNETGLYSVPGGTVCSFTSGPACTKHLNLSFKLKLNLNLKLLSFAQLRFAQFWLTQKFSTSPEIELS